MKVLECSSHGDIRFSAFGAKVNLYGVYDTIENHYQTSKRFGNYKPRTWGQAKGKQPTHFSINDTDFDLKHLASFYKLLWLEYLDCHPELVEYAMQYDDFSDKFKGKSSICQADVIRQYIKEGRESILSDCKEFLELIPHSF
jgi:hypothetical protein